MGSNANLENAITNMKKEDLKDEYRDAPIIPVTVPNYIKILKLVYSKKILRPKQLFILFLFSLPLYAVTFYFLPITEAIIFASGLLLFLLLIIPFSLTCLMFILQKMKIVQPYRRFGVFEENL